MQYAGPFPEGAKYPCASHLAYQRVSMSAGEKFYPWLQYLLLNSQPPAITGRALQAGSRDLDKIATLPVTRPD